MKERLIKCPTCNKKAYLQGINNDNRIFLRIQCFASEKTLVGTTIDKRCRDKFFTQISLDEFDKLLNNKS